MTRAAMDCRGSTVQHERVGTSLETRDGAGAGGAPTPRVPGLGADGAVAGIGR